MSLQFDGNGQVNLAAGFTLSSNAAWSLTFNATYDDSSSFIAGNLTESGPYIGWFSGGLSVRLGVATTYAFTPTVGQTYTVTISNDGAANITVSVAGEGSATGVQNASATFNVFGRYALAGSGNSFVYAGVISGNWTVTGADGGDYRYNFEQPQGSTTLVEELQSDNGTLTNFTTGGFGEPVASNNPPTINILGNNPETITVGDTYTDAGATADDVEDGDLTGSIVTTNNVDPNTEGTYTVDYSVTDTDGETTTASRTVNVEAAAGTPVITIESLVDGASKLQDVNEQATFTLSGSITDGTGPVEYQLDDGAWQVLDSGTGTTFTGTITVTRQQNVSVRLQNDVTVTDTVLYITAAERCIAITPAQSNGAGRGLNFQQPVWDPTKPRPTMYKHNEGFFPLDDPTSNDIDPALGSMWPWYAKLLSDAGVRVCFANVAAGGTRISQWLPGTQLYSKFQGFESAVGGVTDAFGIIGESDTLFDTPKADYKADYLTVAQDITNTYGANFYLVRFPLGPGVVDATNLQDIRDAMDELVAENAFINDGGDLGQIDLTGNEVYTGGSLHLVTDEQLQTGSNIIYSTVEGVSVIEPIITILGDNPATVEQNTTYTDAGATATDFNGNNITVTITSNNVDTTTINTYSVNYSATDSLGNTATVSRTVNVVDTTPPDITILGDNPATVEVNTAYVDAGATATDNSGESITVTTITNNVDTSVAGSYVVEYSATDSSGNIATATRTVEVAPTVNTTPPEITVLGGENITHALNRRWYEPGITIIDDVDGEIFSYSQTGFVDPYTPGEYVLTYTATDSAGNIGVATRTVTVTEITSPANITIDGIPDGSYNMIYYEYSGDTIDLNEPIDIVFVNASDGILSFTSVLASGSQFVGFIVGNNPPATGCAVYGVTE